MGLLYIDLLPAQKSHGTQASVKKTLAQRMLRKRIREKTQ
jgi:hypothetical protein